MLLKFTNQISSEQVFPEKKTNIKEIERGKDLLKHENRCPDNFPSGNLPLVRIRVSVRVWGQFSPGATVLELFLYFEKYFFRDHRKAVKVSLLNI